VCFSGVVATRDASSSPLPARGHVCAAAWGNGAKAMPKTIPNVMGMLGADLKITPVDGSKHRVELGEIWVVLVDCCP